MSKIQFEYDKKFNISAKGSLVSTRKSFPGDDLAAQIQGLVTNFGELKKIYQKSLSNDMQIIGTERIDLLTCTDSIIHLLIVMATQLRGEKQLYHISLDQMHRGFSCSILVQFDSWSANGRMAPDMILPFDSLNDFISGRLYPTVSSFLNQYKNVSADSIIDENEKRILDGEVKKILTSAIHLRFLLSHCLINS